MSSVQRYPSGYLSMIGNVAGGKTPPQAADVIAPVLDMFSLFTSDVSIVRGNFAASAFAGSLGGLINPVPQGELWFVKHVCVFASAGLAVGAAVRWRLWGASSTSGWEFSPTSTSAVAAEQPVLGWDINRWYPSGWSWGVWQESFAGVGAAGTLVVAYNRQTA